MTALHALALSDVPRPVLSEFRRELAHDVRSDRLHGHHANRGELADLKAVRAELGRADWLRICFWLVGMPAYIAGVGVFSWWLS